MKVFISWSGQRSQHIAAALGRWLGDAMTDISLWMSKDSISAGARWADELAEALDESTFGIICLTPESLNSPWVLFEAGAISKIVGRAKVVPYLFEIDPADVSYPLAQFQGVVASKEGTSRLFASINDVRSKSMDAAQLERVFETWWPQLESALKDTPKEENAPNTSRPDRELLEELLNTVRDAQVVKTVREPAKEVDPERYTNKTVPKSAVWKTVHDVSKDEMSHMSTEELKKFRGVLHHRDMVCPPSGEETALYRKLQLVDEVLRAREGSEDDKQQNDH